MKNVKVSAEGRDMFVVVDDIKIAKRGHPGTPHAGTWVSIEPGWEVIDGEDLGSILIKRSGVSVH